ncbi:hypothetical protein K432DRAFT_108661 [Lepidopterella palustris CBS 459.81]|uniref:Uncharacterized protein n=1 Tax=Lepidopterella palustris CBS 459.81 TaxID=1314670 RepID=A0A8E2E5M7_9PEZI|nr:hypothetical protein K432DRAFT_108661 [Lepidopterella palustris CBS 459.81]
MTATVILLSQLVLLDNPPRRKAKRKRKQELRNQRTEKQIGSICVAAQIDICGCTYRGCNEKVVVLSGHYPLQLQTVRKQWHISNRTQGLE